MTPSGRSNESAPLLCKRISPKGWNTPWVPVLFGWVILLAGCDKEPKLTRPDIVLITIDTLRADHLGCYGYDPYDEAVSPHIDAMAEESTVFRNCFAPRGQTMPSLTSLHTGTYPSQHGVRENGVPLRENIPTLAGCLAKSSYETAGFISTLPVGRGGIDRSLFRDFNRPTFFAQGLAGNPHDQDMRDESALEKAMAFIKARGPREARKNPYFLWLHLFDVHKPYDPRAPYRNRFLALEPLHPKVLHQEIDQGALLRRALDPDLHLEVLALYDAGISSADERVGRLVSRLKEIRVWDSAAVVLTSDHGEELGDHQNYYYHGASVYDSVLRVPLLLKLPGGQSPNSIMTSVRNFDAMPTLLETAGVSIPDSVEGHSLHSVSDVADPENQGGPIFGEWQDLIGIVRLGPYKYIHNPRGARPKKPPFNSDPLASYFIDCRELYNLESDPEEKQNSIDSHRPIADDLKSRLEVFMKDPRRDEVMGVSEDAEALKALGYTGTDEARSDVSLNPDECDKKR